MAARLVHDVGKYVARTAHNVAPGGFSPELAQMLWRDLFHLPGGRASVVFERLASPIEGIGGAMPELARARTLLEDIDKLEESVRAGETAALERAARLALAVEDVLRTWARSIQEGPP
jgi:hypothetical protein